MNPKRISVLFTSVLACIVSGCTGMAPARLPSSTKVLPLHLDQPYEYLANFPGGQKMRGYLLPGPYEPVAKDENGTFYLGPKLCFRLIYLDPGWMGRSADVNRTWRVADCGVYVPDDVNGFAMGFTVMGSDLTVDQMRAIDARAAYPGQPPLAQVPLEAFPAMPAGASPVQAGLGVGIGMGLATVLVNAESGRFIFMRNQEESARLRSVLRPVEVN